MKLAHFNDFGEPRDVVKLIEADPDALGPNEVCINIEAAPLHIADIKFIKGELPFYKPLPGTPGMEGIGRVSETGKNVTRFAKGDRVFLPVRVGEKGAFRTDVTLPDTLPIPAPDGDAAQLCLVPINGATAYTILHAMTPLSKGDILIQNAANSNCGRYIIKLAHMMGIKTVNVVRRSELIEELKTLGADHVLVDGDDLTDRVKACVDQQPVKLGLDAVAGWATQRIADSVTDGGLILSYGMLSGDPCMVRPETLFFRDLTLKGFLTFIHFDALPTEQQETMWREIPRMISAGDLSAKIAATYSLDDIHAAFDHASRTGGDRDGKVIITPNI